MFILVQVIIVTVSGMNSLKTHPLHLPVSTTNTFAESSLGREAERCKCYLASSCSYVYFSTGNYSDCVWNEQSKNCLLHLPVSTTNTFAEPGLGNNVSVL